MENMVMISNKVLRATIGILALAFPFLLILGGLMGSGWAVSISQFYWTNAAVIFTGCLTTFGIILLAYPGYDTTDRIITGISGVAMLMVAAFPCKGGEVYLFQFLSQAATAMIHYAAAGIAFTGMGVMSMFQFTKDGGYVTEGKLRRNLAYRICGGIIFTAIVAMLVVELAGWRPATDPVRLFFWLESLVVLAFGFSWLVKAQVIMGD